MQSARARVVALAVLAGAVRLPSAGQPIGPDEAGFLMVASQWSPGSSLYGDYFVDRPPLLVALFRLADVLGGTVWSVRALGVVAGVVAVLLAGLLGRLAASGRWAPVLTAATAAVLSTTPLFDGTTVSGELLALPILLGGCVCVVLALQAAGRRSWWWAVAAGALGAASALVKQSLVDVFVVAAVALLVHRRPRLLVAGAVGAVVVVAATVGAAALLGTDPGQLWYAVVDFRGRATEVIAESATAATGTRFRTMIEWLLLSGAPVLLVLLGTSLRRPADPEVATAPDLRWPAIAVLAWEVFVMLTGGSYWPHYLMGLVTGLVLLTAAAAQRPPPSPRWLFARYVVPVMSTVVALVWFVVQPPGRVGDDAITWLEAHAERGETGLVAYGGASVLYETGLRSPYEHLWSLPVRVDDPDLSELSDLLASPSRPTWLVLRQPTFATWGVDATEADVLLRLHYELADEEPDDWTVYRAVEPAG